MATPPATFSHVCCPMTDPRYATPINLAFDNDLRLARRIAKVLGLPLQEWQQGVIALFSEMDGNGRYAHPDCTLLISRQSGKSYAAFVLILCQMLKYPGSQVWMSAQDLKSARAMLVEVYWPLIVNSPLANEFNLRKASGSEQLIASNGSVLHLLTATSTKAGHGSTADLVIIDEAFAVDQRVEVAMRPAQATRTNFGGGPRFIVISTAGVSDGTSAWLWSKVEQGRQLNGSTAYVEFSAPEDADPSDPAVWRACNPSLGHTITEDAIRAEFEGLDTTAFQRSRLCQWTVAHEAPVISLDVWDSLFDVSSRRGESLTLAFDSAPDGSRSSIAVASERADGFIHSEVVAVGDGTGWLAAEVERLYTAHKPYLIVCDSRSPAANALPALLAANVPVTELPAGERPKAFSAFCAAVFDGKLRHVGQVQLTEALVGAVKKPNGDAFSWSRRSSTVDISPLVAVTEAVYVLVSGPSPGPITFVRLDDVVNEMRSRSFNPYQMQQFHDLLDTQPREQWPMLLRVRGKDPKTVQAIIDAMDGNIDEEDDEWLVDKPMPYLPPPRAWQQWADRAVADLVNGPEEAPDLQYFHRTEASP